MTPFEVVIVPFPFTNLRSFKRRPCLVLSEFHQQKVGSHLIVAMMTSNLSRLSFPFDVEVTDWSEAGLPKPTIIRLAKVVTIDAGLVQKKLGRLAHRDQQTVRVHFKKLFRSIL